MSVDYKFDNKEALTGTDLWSNDASDPILQGVNWRKEIVAACGISPNVMLMDSETALVLTNNKKVKERFDIQRYNFGKIEPFIQEPLLTFYGRLPILGADVYAYDAMYKDPDTGQETPYIPPKTVLFASTLTQNRMYYGAITIMDNRGCTTPLKCRVSQLSSSIRIPLRRPCACSHVLYRFHLTLRAGPFASCGNRLCTGA